MFGIQNEREWAAFCREVLDAPDMIQDRRFVSNALRVENRVALDAIIANIFRGLTRNALIVRLKGARIAYGSLNPVKDAARHPQLRRIEIAAPSGPVRAPASVIGGPFGARMRSGPVVLRRVRDGRHGRDDRCGRRRWRRGDGWYGGRGERRIRRGAMAEATQARAAAQRQHGAGHAQEAPPSQDASGVHETSSILMPSGSFISSASVFGGCCLVVISARQRSWPACWPLT